MHFIKNGFIAIIGMMIFFSCTGDGASVENAAKNICECTQPVVKINQEVQALQRAGKVDELTILIEKTGAAFDTAVKCTKENVDDKMDKEKLKTALGKVCEMNPKLINDLMNKL